jgi:hypothetical protein
MQRQSARDMSLPERVAVLERRLEKSENKRKILMGLLLEMMQRQNMIFTEKGKEALLELES